MKLTTNSDRKPEPHRRYLVLRSGRWFVATPCYGMHSPWWVPSGPLKDGDPVGMEDGDQWIPMDNFKAVCVEE